MAYAITLLVTLLIEGVVVFLFGFRTAVDQIRIALISGITHPLLYLSLMFLEAFRWRGMADIEGAILILEGCVVAVEFLLLLWIYPKKRKMFLFLVSLSMNGASAFIGFFSFF